MDSEKLAVLKSSALFKDLTEPVLAEISAIVEELAFEAGATIIRKGDPGDSMFIIRAGRVRVHDGGRTLDQMEAGDVFGEMAVLDAGARSASVTALDDVRLLRLDTNALYALMGDHPEVGRAVIRTLTGRLRARLRDMREDYDYIQQVERIIAAANAVEAGTYELGELDEVSRRSDPLGQLARVFRHMVREVEAREIRLKNQVHELRIEIDRTRQAKKVEEITGSEYFKNLRGQADALRQIIDGEDSPVK